MVNTHANNVNPLLLNWQDDNVFGLPNFSAIKAEHFKPAFDIVLKDHKTLITSIASNSDAPTFDNTIKELDKSYIIKSKISSVFSNLCSSLNSPELQLVQAEMAPLLAMHHSSVYMEPNLFDRVNTVFIKRESLGLSSEEIRLTERYHLDFVRAGASMSPEDQRKYALLMKKHAELTTAFQQNCQNDEAAWSLEITEDDMEGCSDSLKSAAQAQAQEKGLKDGAYLLTLSRSIVEPFLKSSSRRDLRKKVFEAFTSRGRMVPSRDNLKIAREILSIRAEQASMHGYKCYADYATADTMAGSPDKVLDLLEKVWKPAKLSSENERSSLEMMLKSTVTNDDNEGDSKRSKLVLEPWDWRYLAEQVRKERYDIDDSELKPYFTLENVVAAAFDSASQLFGIHFELLPNEQSYHPDVNVYKVTNTADDTLVGIFMHDNYARSYKNSGAWMSSLRDQHKNHLVANLPAELTVPIVLNNNNFMKGGGLSFDDVRTLFHELGHGLHGLLSSVTYRRLSGTSVLTDFVELPSQLFEHWMEQPEVMKKHFKHQETGEPIPDYLMDKLKAASQFNQGFSTIEYSISAFVDVALHSIGSNDETVKSPTGEMVEIDGEPLCPLLNIDVAEFEMNECKRLNLPQGIVPRHKASHFQHLFSTSMYASQYYVYLWASVLDNDAFESFMENGDCFHQETAQKLRQFIYSAGNSEDPAQLYRNFRGRDPVIEPMLKSRGLLQTC